MPPCSRNQSPYLAKESAPVPTLAQAERAAILTALQACHGHVAQAAELLDVAPSTLYRKLNGWVAAPKTDEQD